MNDSQELMRKISALRQRLHQAQGLVPTAAHSLVHGDKANAAALQALDRRIEKGNEENRHIEGLLGQLPEGSPAQLPSHLTSRSIRLLKNCRDHLHEARELGQEAVFQDEENALAELHRDVVVMLNAVLRAVQSFPSTPSAQFKACEGLEAVMKMIGEKLAILKAGLGQEHKDQGRIEALACLLEDLVAGKPLGFVAFLPLVDAIVAEARTNQPLRWHRASFHTPARLIAAHSLNVAQVLARLFIADPEWKTSDQDALIPALVHDVGMLKIPAAILAQEKPLNADQRRQVELHPLHSAELARNLWPGGGWMLDAIAEHHERIDGAGYPGGKKDVQITTFAKLLSVCDVYAALCEPRPYRASHDTRSALTDALLLAEREILDKDQAERLLILSFYPVGSVVELSDGSTAVVVGTHSSPRGLSQPHKPIVSLLTDAERQPLPSPCQLDLLHDERAILRTLPSVERRQLLTSRFPALV